MGRYTLKANMNDRIEFSIKVFDGEKLREKVSLMAIDYYTSDKSLYDLLKEVEFEHVFLKGNIKFYISYFAKGEERRIDAIFMDSYGLKEIASIGNRQISIQNKIFLNFIDNIFLPLIIKEEFRQFLKSHRLIGYKLIEWISKYLSKDYSLDYCHNKILEYASEYYQFRNLILGVELYNKVFINKPVLREEKLYSERFALQYQDDDPDRCFGLFTEEELRKYGEYLDNLPSSERELILRVLPK